MNLLVILFYAGVTFVAAIVLITLSLDKITLDYLTHHFHLHQFKGIVGAAGAILFLVNLLMLRIAIPYTVRRKKIIFKRGNARVTVSLNAIENLIKRLAEQLPEIKDMRSQVLVGSKNRVKVLMRATLQTPTPVPEAIEKAQNYIKSRLQETLGPEADLVVRIQIDKIVPAGRQ